MKVFKLIYVTFAVAMMATSCRVTEKIDPDLDIPGLGGYEYPETELDLWLKETFLDGYNIEVIYRWDAVKMVTDVSHKLVPVSVDVVKPMMKTIARIWFDPYTAVADVGFLQKYSPKTIVLCGSPEYQSATAMVMGTAEGAVKILLTNANAFSSTNRTVLRDYMHVIQHEFTHILNQSVAFGTSFQDISAGTYEPSTWDEYEDDSEAFIRGFLSPYAMVSPDEDYAETLSLILVNGLDWLENEVIPVAEGSTVDPRAAQKIRDKINHVADYLFISFGIRLLDDAEGNKGFVTHVQEAIDFVIDEALADGL